MAAPTEASEKLGSDCAAARRTEDPGTQRALFDGGNWGVILGLVNNSHLGRDLLLEIARLPVAASSSNPLLIDRWLEVREIASAKLGRLTLE